MRPGQQQEKEYSCQFDEDEDAVQFRAFLRTADQEETQQQRNKDGGNVDDAAIGRNMCQRMTDANPR